MLTIQKQGANIFLILLSLPATAMGFALSIQISALSYILYFKYNLAIHEIGLVWAAGPIAGIFGQVIVGLISDNVWFWKGRRRPFILVGGGLAALMLFALPNLDFIREKLGMDAILGIAITVALMLDMSINISFNPTRAIIADVTDDSHRTKGYTWMQTISGTFGVLAYAIGALLGKMFLIYFGVCLVFLFSVIPVFFIEEPRSLSSNSEEKNQGQKWLQSLMAIQPLWGMLLYSVYKLIVELVGSIEEHMVVSYTLLGISIVSMIGLFVRKKDNDNDQHEFQKILSAHSFTWLGVQTMFVYIFAYIDGEMIQLDQDAIGSVIDIAFLLLNLVGALLPVLVLEPLTRRIGRTKTHFISLLIMALSYAGIAWVGNSTTGLYLFMVIAGVGWAATVSLPFAIMSERIDKRLMGLYMGLFNLSVVLPQLIASLFIGNLIEEATNKNVVFIIAAIALGISAFLWSLIKDKSVVN